MCLGMVFTSPVAVYEETEYKFPNQPYAVNFFHNLRLSWEEFTR